MFADTCLDTAISLDFDFLGLVVERTYGLMTNWILIAGTTSIFMGNMLDTSGIAEGLHSSTQELFGNVRGGLAVTVALIGATPMASIGIIGASVVLLAVLSVPVLAAKNYSKELAVGTVAASGRLDCVLLVMARSVAACSCLSTIGCSRLSRPEYASRFDVTLGNWSLRKPSMTATGPCQ